MDESVAEKYSLDKVALLALFAVGLLAAQVVVSVRGRVSLGETAALPAGGLKVAVPAGGGWRSSGRWEYEGDRFVLSSNLESAAGGTQMRLRWEYLLAPLEDSARQWLERRQAQASADRRDGGEIECDGFVLEWAALCCEEAATDITIGAARLGQGRMLTLQLQSVGDDGTRDSLFDSVVRATEVTDNEALQRGAEIVKASVEGLFSGSRYNGVGQDYFLISDRAGRVVGFAGGLWGTATVDGRSLLKAVDVHYFRGRFAGQGRGRSSMFELDGQGSGFRWVSRGHGGAAGEGSGRAIRMDEEGVVTVSSADGSLARRFRPGSAAVAEVLFDHIVKTAVRRAAGAEVLVDLISVEGRVTPVRIYDISERRSATETGRAADEEAGGGYTARLEFLDGSGHRQEVELDADGNLVEAEIQQQEVFMLRRAQRDEVLRHFPKWREYILGMAGMIEPRGSAEFL